VHCAVTRAARGAAVIPLSTIYQISELLVVFARIRAFCHIAPSSAKSIGRVNGERNEGYNACQ
jgi:hypothetical protein